MNLSGPIPLVGVPACAQEVGGYPSYTAGEKYVRAVSEGARALPFVIPPLGTGIDIDDLAARLDGLLVTGSLSNVEPHRYGGGPDLSLPPHDPARDATTLPLIQACLRRSVPILAICRGLQELNVAMGGTLHPRVHEVPGRMDHRARGQTSEERYAPAHPVRILPGGRLAAIAGTGEATVNSLHWQGIDRLAPGLRVEAEAPDGTIEAVSVEAAGAFALAVQWHPEWRFAENPLSTRLLAAFGEAARSRALARTRRAAAE